MSYEGYEQCICANGHRFDVDVHYNDWPCECGENAVWSNSVDTTNCDSYGIIADESWNLFLIEEEKRETCPCCQHTKIISHARYRVPTNEEAQRLRLRRETLDNGEHRLVNIQEDREVSEVVEG
jgi:hypothetical protein